MTLDQGYQQMERSLSALDALKTAIRGTLPLAEAESCLDDIEDLFDQAHARLTGAKAILGAELDRLECAEAA